MNYLVYRGLIHPKYQGIKEVQTARRRLAKASKQLLLGEWLKHGRKMLLSLTLSQKFCLPKKKVLSNNTAMSDAMLRCS